MKKTITDPAVPAIITAIRIHASVARRRTFRRRGAVTGERKRAGWNSLRTAKPLSESMSALEGATCSQSGPSAQKGTDRVCSVQEVPSK